MQETDNETSSWKKHREGVKMLKASQCQGQESEKKKHGNYNYLGPEFPSAAVRMCYSCEYGFSRTETQRKGIN